jgi:hypothetical protein
MNDNISIAQAYKKLASTQKQQADQTRQKAIQAEINEYAAKISNLHRQLQQLKDFDQIMEKIHNCATKANNDTVYFNNGISTQHVEDLLALGFTVQVKPDQTIVSW